MLPNFGICCRELRGLKVTSFRACVRSFCSVATRIDFLLTHPLQKWDSIALGANHLCGITLLTSKLKLHWEVISVTAKMCAAYLVECIQHGKKAKKQTLFEQEQDSSIQGSTSAIQSAKAASRR